MSLPPRNASAATLVRAGTTATAMRSRRFELSGAQWTELVQRLGSDPVTVAGLWSDGDRVHALLLESPDVPLIASVAVDNKRVLALSPGRPALAVPERILRDLWGIEAMGALDLRPWLDHGAWTQTAPLSARPGPVAWPPEPSEFAWSDADAAAGAMQLPLGPVQALMRGPAQLRVTLLGERVRRLEPLLGFNHRGVAMRLRGATPAEASALVGRIDAGATVAHQAAFAQAVEDACGWAVDGGSRGLRLGMLALERIGMRLRQLGLLQQRDRLLDGCAAAFGHRMMRDAIAPGGWAVPPDPYGLGALPELLSRVALGLERQPGATVASLRGDIQQARRGLAASPSEPMPDRMPASGTPGAPAVVEGLGVVDTLHGRLWHWVRLDSGRIAAWHAVDPQLDRLAELVATAPGGTLDQVRARFDAAGLSAPGADQ